MPRYTLHKYNVMPDRYCDLKPIGEIYDKWLPELERRLEEGDGELRDIVIAHLRKVAVEAETVARWLETGEQVENLVLSARINS